MTDMDPQQRVEQWIAEGRSRAFPDDRMCQGRRAPLLSLQLPIGRRHPTLIEQVPAIEHMLKILGRDGGRTHYVKDANTNKEAAP
jgi:hypothetical protein